MTTKPTDLPGCWCGATYSADPAVDAATRLTASSWGPPFASDLPAEGEDADWWLEAYKCACSAVERQVIDAIRASGEF